MPKGIVVQNKVTGNVYAVSEENMNPDQERFLRDLRSGESTFSFIHKAKKDLKEEFKEEQEKAPEDHDLRPAQERSVDEGEQLQLPLEDEEAATTDQSTTPATPDVAISEEEN